MSEGNGSIKRFSTEESREFEVGGEVFKWRYPYWEDIAKVFDGDLNTAAQAAVDEVAAEGEEEKPATVYHDMIEDYIKRIEMFIDPVDDGVKRWRAAARRKTNPIPHAQFADVYNWLLGVTSGRRPTETSSPSSAGPSASAAISRVGSS